MKQENMRFPLFVDLTGKKAVVVGGGAIACRRIGVLLDFGAAVTVVSPTLAEHRDRVDWVPRGYEPGDLKGAFLAVAATDDRTVNRAAGEEAKALCIPVSVADRKEESTFFFPAVCVGGGVVAGLVSLGGEDHRRTAEAAGRIRAGLEELK